jgi:Tfp pilus assembly protein PilZ
MALRNTASISSRSASGSFSSRSSSAASDARSYGASEPGAPSTEAAAAEQSGSFVRRSVRSSISGFFGRTEARTPDVALADLVDGWDDLVDTGVRARRVTGGRLDVHVRLGDDASSYLYADLDGDPARGGVFVATYRRLLPGERVVLTLEADVGSVVCEGVVSFVAEGGGDGARGVGVAFAALDDDQVQALRAFAAVRPPVYLDVREDVFVIRSLARSA